MFYGIVIYLFFFDNREHNKPHIHAEFQNLKQFFSIDELGLFYLGPN